MVEKIKGFVGPMSSAKTAKLKKLAELEEIAHRKPQVFKPIISARDEGADFIKSRGGEPFPATSVGTPKEILDHLEPDTTLVLIDEAQFFNDMSVDGRFTIGAVVEEIAERNVQVVFAGLKRDFRREPFGPMPDLMARADEIEECTAICTNEINGRRCGKPATETQRFVEAERASYHDPVVLVGDLVGDKEEGYEPFCKECHSVKDRPQRKFE